MANKTETVTAGPEETDSWAADLSPPQTAARFGLSPALKPQQQPCSPSAVILHISIPVCSAALWEIKSAFFHNMTHFVLSKGIVFNAQGLRCRCVQAIFTCCRSEQLDGGESKGFFFVN